ncbi:MAG: 50S ribosomal protein L5 [Candidatus Kuenenia sp.]|nr:50S ribosomal protein L5 [Candidatus Kuenenia hertensis]
MARLLEKYKEEIVPYLREKFLFKNNLSVPKIQKVVINMGVGKAVDNKNFLDEAIGHLTTISGQKPAVTVARKSVSGFKLREGQAIGCKVTLRGGRMFEFIDRLISIVLPRIKDFRGVSPKSFDGQGNYTLGLTEQTVFPEVNIEKVTNIQGMDVTFVISGKSDECSYELLRSLGMPFRSE